MVRLKRLNHIFLLVRDLKRSVEFYRDVLGMVPVATMGDEKVFLRARASANHHDLALGSVGMEAPLPPHGSTGLFHMAWEVETIDDIADAYEALKTAGVFLRATDHNISKSVYGQDPDGNGFELTWMLPRSAWAPGAESEAVSRALDLPRELERFSTRKQPATEAS
jgi:catechol-2,3-dioxygenase